MKKIIFILLIPVLLQGCARHVHKDWMAIGGSKADASVTVGYTYNAQIEIPDADFSQAQRVADEKCRAWGYERAEAFGGALTSPMNIYEVMTSAKFQCIGGTTVTPEEKKHLNGRIVK